MDHKSRPSIVEKHISFYRGRGRFGDGYRRTGVVVDRAAHHRAARIAGELDRRSAGIRDLVALDNDIAVINVQAPLADSEALDAGAVNSRRCYLSEYHRLVSGTRNQVDPVL